MSNYIMDLRKIVGHRTLIQCAASIICIEKKAVSFSGDGPTITCGDIPAELWK